MVHPTEFESVTSAFGAEFEPFLGLQLLSKLLLYMHIILDDTSAYHTISVDFVPICPKNRS